MNVVSRLSISASSADFSGLFLEHDLVGFWPEAIKLGQIDLWGLKMKAEIEGVEVLLGPESLFAAVAYMILTKHDDLLDNRLTEQGKII